MIPTYKEPLGTLRKTVGTLAAQTCANERLIVVLATESRDTEAPEKVNELIDEFGPALLGLFYTKHVLAPGEAVGKSSNCAWSVRCVKRDFVEKLPCAPSKLCSQCATPTHTLTRNSWIAWLTITCKKPETVQHDVSSLRNFLPEHLERADPHSYQGGDR